MKIYFAGSIRGNTESRDIFPQIVAQLNEHGTVLTEHIADKNLTGVGETDISDQEIYRRDISLIREADVMVAEVSSPSLGVGYEIATAESLNKPVICLVQDRPNGQLSAMIKGNENLRLFSYRTIADIDPVIKEQLSNTLL